MRKKRRIIGGILVLFSMIVVGTVVILLTKHNKESETDFEINEALRIMDDPVLMETYMLYGVDIKNGYELQYGSDFWQEMTTDYTGNTVTYEIAAKEDIAEQIRLVKVLCKEAEVQGLRIDEAEDSVLTESATEYYNALYDAGMTDESFTPDIVIDYYRENYLAEKMYSKLSEELGEDEDKLLAKVKELVVQYDSKFSYLESMNWGLINLLSFGDEEDSSLDELSDLTLLQDYYEEGAVDDPN